MLHASLSVLSATASPPCTLNIPAHNVHYDLRGVPGVSGAYSGASDRSVNEGLAEASELLSAGHRSQPWFDITSYDVGQMRGAAAIIAKQAAKKRAGATTPPCHWACPRGLVGNGNCDQRCNVPQCGYDGGDCGSGGAHKAPPKAAPAAARVHRPPKLKALVADAPSPASASKPTRRAAREGRGALAAVLLGAAAVGVGVWRVALSKSHW